MAHHAGEVGSQEHFQSWSAEHEMKEKTKAMQEDIKEKMVMGLAQKLESQIDKQMEDQEEELSDIQALRKKRLLAMQKDAKMKKELLALGHGKYDEIENEKDFFEWAKKSERMVCHFYREETFRCGIVDKHMKILAPKYWKTRFCKINAEKSPFLVERLKVFMLPTITCVIKGQVADHIVGFDDMGGADDFPTSALAARLGAVGVCDYDGGDVEAAAAARQKAAGKGKGYVGHQRCKGDSDSDLSSDEY